MKHQLYIMITSIIILIGSLTIGCDYFSSEKTITQGIYFFPNNLDPTQPHDFYEFQIYSQIYETLLTIGNDYITLKPGLAKSWSTSEDYTVYNLTLKPNIFFHDKSKLSAHTIKYAFEYHIQKRPKYLFYKMIKTITVIDSLTVQITLRYPFAPFLYTLTSPHGFHAISPLALKRYGNQVDKYPSGTGPFYLEEWINGRSIVLKSDPKYCEQNKIDKIKFILSSHPSEAEILFKDGQLDILYLVAGYWLDRLKWQGKVEYYVQKPLNTIYIGFNLQNELIKDRLLRQTILKAINIEKVVSITNRGNAFVAQCPLPPLYAGFTDLHQGSYDPDQAKSILKQIGTDNTLTLNLFVASYVFSRLTIVELIKSELAKIGISLKVQLFDSWETFATAINDKQCQLFLNGYGSELIGDPGNFLYALFHSQSEDNQTHYSNNQVDILIESALREADGDKRHTMYRRIVQMILADIPAVYLAHVKSHFAYNSQKIKSLAVNPYEFIYYHRLEIYE